MTSVKSRGQRDLAGGIIASKTAGAAFDFWSCQAHILDFFTKQTTAWLAENQGLFALLDSGTLEFKSMDIVVRSICPDRDALALFGFMGVLPTFDRIAIGSRTFGLNSTSGQPL